MRVKDYEHMLSINLRAMAYTAVIPSMNENAGGSIVNIASFHARAADPGSSVYTASKAGLLALTRGIAVDYSRYGMQVNSLVRDG